MLVPNSFDLWQKDAFFSAAEEVQESADTMESIFRKWNKGRGEGLGFQELDELSRELQTALGTAKWQLEEFGKAVRLSYRNRSDENTAARHIQFVAAIDDQICHVESSLREFLSEDREQPLRWVNLDEDECDELATFLSGTPGTSQTTNNGSSSGISTVSSVQEFEYIKRTADFDTKSTNKYNYMNAKRVCNEPKEIPRTRDGLNSPAERTVGTRRTWSAQDIGSWKIVISDEDEQKKGIVPTMEDSPKEKGSKPVFSKQTCGDRLVNGGIISYSQLRRITWINQILGRVGGRQRLLHRPVYLQFSRSVRLTLALLIMIFLFVPFILYST